MTKHAELIVFRKEGTRPPLFLVHPVSGQVECYRALAAALPEDQPVLAIAAASAALETVEELAAEYLLSLGSGSRFTVAGWAFGGLIALELARRLPSRARLVIVDARVPEGEKTFSEEELRQMHAKHDRRFELESAYAIFARNVRALGRYRPHLYQGSTRIIRSREELAEHPRPPTLGWERVITCPFDQVTTAGNHFNLLKEPHARELACHLLFEEDAHV